MPSDPHAIIANWRLAVRWTIDGQAHVARLYVGEVVNNAGAWYFTNQWTPATLLPWEDCSDRFASLVHACGLDSEVFSESYLEYRDGNIWTLLDTDLPTVDAGGTNPFNWGGRQLTITMRDNNLNRFKLVLEERNEAADYTSRSPTSGNGSTDALISALTVTGGDDYDPVNWMVSKYMVHVKAGGFVSWATYPNKRVLRRRGRK